MLRYLLFAGAAAHFALSAAPAAAAVVIDSFDTVQRQDTDDGTPFGPSGVVSGPGILGLERDVTVVQHVGVGSVSMNIDPMNSSLALYSETSNAEGEFSIQYDGNDGNPGAVNYTGLGGVNLAPSGEVGFVLQGFNNSGGSNSSTFRLKVYTDEDNFFEHEFTIPDGTVGDVFIPFSAFTETGNASFSNVGAIVFDGDINGGQSTDFSLDGIITATPEPSGLLLLTMSLAGVIGYSRRNRRANKELSSSST